MDRAVHTISNILERKQEEMSVIVIIEIELYGASYGNSRLPTISDLKLFDLHIIRDITIRQSSVLRSEEISIIDHRRAVEY